MIEIILICRTYNLSEENEKQRLTEKIKKSKYVLLKV
jgi:hypothetical protein